VPLVRNATTKKLRRAGMAAFAPFGIAVVMAGCSTSVSVGGDDETVDKSSEVSQARKTLDALPDLPPAESIDCPSDVEAKANTTYECHATLTNGQEVTLPARVASANGNDANIQNNLDVVNQALAVDVIYKALDPTVPKTVDCPTGVPAKVKKTFDCKVTAKNGDTATFTLKIQATAPRQDLVVSRVH
jgi:hypothetical protein